MSSEPMDRPVHAPPPPGGGPVPRERPPTPAPEPELWPEDVLEEPMDEGWIRESELGDEGWEEPDDIAEEPDQPWPDDRQDGPGVELADEPDQEQASEDEDAWDREQDSALPAERT